MPWISGALFSLFFFFNDPAPTEIYTLPLHDALPILQLLCQASDEPPGAPGLGVIAGGCRRLPADVRVPHLGWNTVTAPSSARLVTTGVAAFANSYALRDPPPGWTASWTTHGVRFVAGVGHDGGLAWQLHPQ